MAVMTPDAAGIEAALAAGLAAHQMVATAYYQRTHQWGASCRAGDWSERGEMGGRDAAEAAHRAHVAAALLPVVTQAQAEAWDAGYLRAVEPSSDIRDNPYRARADESGA